MTKTAIVDIDNTLWQFCDAFYEELRKVNKDFPTPDNWSRWDIWEGYCTEDVFYKAVNVIHASQDGDRYWPYPESKNFLETWAREGYHITIASHRSPEFMPQTKRWLEKHGLVHNELHLSFDKTSLLNELTTVVVDDSPDVLKKAVENGALATGLLFPWNRAYSGNGFRLCSDLDEVLEGIIRR